MDHRRYMPPGSYDDQIEAASETRDPQQSYAQPEAQGTEDALPPTHSLGVPVDGDDKPAPWAVSAANVMSTVFSPLLIPAYACAMALWITILSVIPEHNRFIICLIIFAITTLLPFGLVLFLIRTQRISDMAISQRNQRALPFVLALVCYGAAVLFLHKIHAPHWLAGFYTGALICTVAAFFINIGWKVSIHSMSMGGLTAMAFFIAIHGLAVVKMLPWVLALLVLSGAVMTSRLILKRHTPAQTYVGWLLGFCTVFFCM